MADEEMAEEYDSREDTEKHIKRVGEYLTKCIIELVHKAEMHDYDKIHNEKEKAMFDEYTPKLKHCTYGSEEYKSFLAGLKPALDIHYANNRYHPEHFENGIHGMNLLDVLEMICDWKASSERHSDGDIYKSIEINQKRFGYSDDLKNILKNTADFLVNKQEYLDLGKNGAYPPLWERIGELWGEGAEFGYNKANEWHYVKDGDLPKVKTWVIGFYYGKDNWHKIFYRADGNWWGEGQLCQPPYAWKEIVLPGLEEIKENENFGIAKTN